MAAKASEGVYRWEGLYMLRLPLQAVLGSSMQCKGAGPILLAYTRAPCTRNRIRKDFAPLFREVYSLKLYNPATPSRVELPRVGAPQRNLECSVRGKAMEFCGT